MQVERLFENFEKQGFTVHNYEMDLTTKNGTKRTISWNSVNRFDSQGHLQSIGVFCVVEAEPILQSRNKWTCFQILSKSNIPVPKTFLGNAYDVEAMLEKFGSQRVL